VTETAAPPRLDEIVGGDGVSSFAQAIFAQLQSEAHAASKLKLPKILGETIVQRMTAAMHIDVLSFLAEGWNAALELDDCRRRSKLAPTSTIVATLGRHTVEHDLKPTILINFGVSKSFAVDATVAVEGNFDGVELCFEGGRLVSVGSGQCDLSVALKVADKLIGAPHQLKSWRLPGAYRLVPKASPPSSPSA
jgi:hypothetical protein